MATHLLIIGIAPLEASIPVPHLNSFVPSGLLPITWSRPPLFLFIRLESHCISISTKYASSTRVEWLILGLRIKQRHTSWIWGKFFIFSIMYQVKAIVLDTSLLIVRPLPISWSPWQTPMDVFLEPESSINHARPLNLPNISSSLSMENPTQMR